MKRIFVSMIAIAIAVIGIAASQDFINQIGGTPLIKDLGNLSMAEISAIFSGDGAWLNSHYTASIDAFRADNKADGKPIGNVTQKHMYVGSAWKGNA